jgi:3-hydroxyisobutyrate dehydrogenase-like beta-hydroxyacid dehydrogenase
VSKTLDPAFSVVYSYWTVGDHNDPRLAVGLIGLGNMGTAIAERVLDGGYELVVYNRTPERAAPLAARGAAVAETPAELAAQVDVVLTSLANDDALEAVSAAVVSAARPGTVLVDMSTVSPAVSERVASLADDASIAYLRAPVSGNPTVVRAGNLSFIVSGAPEALERVEPLLRSIGSTVHLVGSREEARVVKLAINLMIGGLAQLMAEALVLAEAAGVSRAAILEVMEKDVDLVLDATETAGVELPMATLMKEILRAAIAAGYGDADFMALFLHLRGASDQEVMR